MGLKWNILVQHTTNLKILKLCLRGQFKFSAGSPAQRPPCTPPQDEVEAADLPGPGAAGAGGEGGGANEEGGGAPPPLHGPPGTFLPRCPGLAYPQAALELYYRTQLRSLPLLVTLLVKKIQSRVYGIFSSTLFKPVLSNFLFAIFFVFY